MAGNIVQGLRDEIENRILTGELGPGARLDEVQLATRFGVSRTPIREALMQLGATGLVDIRPRRGAVVIELGPERLYEMFEVMAELEGLAGAHAARRHTDEDRAALIAAHDKCVMSTESGGTDANYYDNELFHGAIYAASHSVFLAEQCSALHRRLRPYRRLQLRVRNRMKVSLTEHANIVDAIFAGDADGARSLLRDHIAVQGDRFSDLVASLGSRERSRRQTESAQ